MAYHKGLPARNREIPHTEETKNYPMDEVARRHISEGQLRYLQNKCQQLPGFQQQGT